MVMMLKKIFSDPKRVVILVAIAILVLFVCAAVLIFGGWSLFNQSEPASTVEPVSFGYCGAEFTDLCVVSFGRDALGGTVINLYVPIKEYPVFYLNIVRQSGEQRFICEWNKDVRTSVYCVGPSLNLGEGFKIQIFSEKGNIFLAEGEFTLTAFRVTTPMVGNGDSATTPGGFTEESASDAEETSTPTSSEVISESGTITPTASDSNFDADTMTPQPSYPSYP